MRIIPVIDLRAGEAVHGIGGDRARYEPVEIRAHAFAGRCAGARAGVRRRCSGRASCTWRISMRSRGGAAQYAMHQRLSRVARSWIDAGLGVGRGRVRADRCGCGSGGGGARDAAGTSRCCMRSYCGSERIGWRSVSICGMARRSRARSALRAMTPRELARRAVDAGVETVIVLDLARVGGLGGADDAMMREIRAALPGVDLIAGGGVRDQADLDRLAAAGANGALVATALHRGVIGAAVRDGRAVVLVVRAVCALLHARHARHDRHVRHAGIAARSNRLASIRRHGLHVHSTSRATRAPSLDATRACRCTSEVSRCRA